MAAKQPQCPKCKGTIIHREHMVKSTEMFDDERNEWYVLWTKNAGKFVYICTSCYHEWEPTIAELWA